MVCRERIQAFEVELTAAASAELSSDERIRPENLSAALEGCDEETRAVVLSELMKLTASKIPTAAGKSAPADPAHDAPMDDAEVEPAAKEDAAVEPALTAEEKSVKAAAFGSLVYQTCGKRAAAEAACSAMLGLPVFGAKATNVLQTAREPVGPHDGSRMRSASLQHLQQSKRPMPMPTC